MDSQLGQGGYSVVHGQGAVAIKTISHKNFESGIREIAIINMLSHPNIIKINKIGYGGESTKIYMKKYKLYISGTFFISSDNYGDLELEGIRSQLEFYIC